MRLFLLISAIFLASLASAEELFRNPFWPQGYEGRRQPISAAPRYPTKPPPALREGADSAETTRRAAPKKALTGNDALWEAARLSLKVRDACRLDEGGTIRSSARINGRLYANGDLISITQGSHRFTWLLVEVSTNGTLRLKRVRLRDLSAEGDPSTSQGK